MKRSCPTPRTSRRDFLKAAGLTGLALHAPSVGVWGANDAVGVAVIGLGNKGGQHAGVFSQMAGVRLVALAEVDPKRLAEHAGKVRQNGAAPLTVSDGRRALERSDVDAVVIATPNHWHALWTFWALQAGKDVYVEKPVSHNIWEGGRIVEEAKARGRIVQSGTQYRSCPGLRAAAAWLSEGHVGKPLWAQVVWFEHRPPIGKCAPFTPTDLDYDLWCGPAPREPLTRPKLHYDWHWVWSTGDGDLGNSGIHAFDACRMFLPGAVFPRRIRSLGGRFTYDDAAETPNTQFTVAEYPALPIVIENRNLSLEKDAVVMGDFRRIREGFVVQHEGGYFAGLRSGGAVYDATGKPVKQFPGDGGAGHAANFIQAVRSRGADELRAPIQEGHVSSAVCHLGNLSYRLARPADLRACREALKGAVPVAEGFARLAQSLEGLGVDLDRSPFALGPGLEIDTVSGHITGIAGGDPAALEQARRLARGTYRKPFILPT